MTDGNAPVARGYPEAAALRHCKFCGQNVIDPCTDETDLLIYRVTVDRCNDAAWSRDAEIHYESEVGA